MRAEANRPAPMKPDETGRETAGVERYGRLSVGMAVLVLALGVLVLLGWVLDVEVLKRIRSGYVAMTPLTAVGFTLGGTALLLLRPKAPPPAGLWIGRGLAAAVALLGAATMAQYLFDFDPGLDRLLFPAAVAAERAAPPGRPSPNTAAGFLLSGLALLFVAGRVPRRYVAAHLAALAAAFFALQPLAGYVYDVEAYYGFAPYTPMAFHTALGLIVLAFGVLLVRPGRGLMKTVTAEDVGGHVSRRLLPAAILLPLLLGLLRIVGEAAGLFGAVYGLTLVIVFTMVAFVALVWWNAAELGRLDRRRRAVDAERERLLAREREARERVTGILESLTEGFASIDREWRVTYMNPVAGELGRRFLGRAPEELLGRDMWELVPELRGTRFEREYRRAMEARVSSQFEEYFAPFDTWFETRIDPSPEGLAAFFRDVSARHRAAAERERLLERERAAHAEAVRRAREEAALRRATEAVTATFTVDEVIRRIAETALEATDADGAFVQRIGPQAREIEVIAAAGRHVPPLGERFAYEGSATARVVGRGEPEAFPEAGEEPAAVPDELEKHCPACAAVIVPLVDAGEAIGSLVLVRGPEGDSFHADEVARAGTFGRLAALAFHKVHLLESTERRREELQRVLESRARLMRGFSHDVKNPLGAAEGQLALLEGGALDGLAPGQRKGVARARRSIGSAMRLIDSLVELARAEAGRMRLDYTITDVRSLAREVAEEYRAGAEAKGLAVDVELPEELPVIRSDPDRIRQILGNLLSNAVKYSERGRIRVRVARRSGSPAPGPGRWIAIDVIDTGPGIPEDKHEEVFGEFTRLEPGEGRGAGLGLAISRRVARLLGGDVTLQSEPGRGSTFTIWLPVDVGGERARRNEADASSEASLDYAPDRHR